MNLGTMHAIFKRDLVSYFGSLTGYLYVVAFVFLATVAAIRPGPFGAQFFPANKANLDLLTEWFPLLVSVFVPLMTMSAWSRELDRGTDHLLLTLPARDGEIVFAKFAAALGVYTVALASTAGLVAALVYLGSPDPGLMIATYLGYWLLGAAAVALSMIGSALTRNMAVAWLLGAGLCLLAFVAPAVAGRVGGSALAELSALARFEAFGTGVVALEDVVYFVGLTGLGLFANTFLLGWRHWTLGSDRLHHGAVRLTSVFVAFISLVVLLERASARVDITSAQLLTLNEQAEKVLDRLGEGEPPLPPVLIQAWISPQVPDEYRATREGLIRMLREFDAAGGDHVQVAIYDTELYSEEAKEAEERFGIKPRAVQGEFGGRKTAEEIFLGLAFTCGARETRIEFFDRGLPIQYELTHAIGTVAQVERSKVGVLKSGVDMFGGFDFQSMSRSEDWQFLGDLRKQYEVVKVDGTAAIDTSLDVLVVPLPSSLTQEKMNRVAEYLWDGGKALFLCDPYPEFDPNLAPLRPAGGNKNPFMQQPTQQNEGPKGDIEPLLAGMGVTWHKDRITWDQYNPHPEWPIPRELVFIAPAAGERPEGFNGDDPVTSGLQEVVLIFGGELAKAPGSDGIEFTPLLRTGTHSGYQTWHDMVQESFFGVMPKPEQLRRYESLGEQRVVAARVKGKLSAPADGERMKRGQRSDEEFEAIVVADLDLVSDVFYGLRRQGNAEFNLDNVTFAANCIDSLAGDDSYIALRKLRPAHRTLEVIEQVEQELNERVREATEKAREEAKEQLAEAQERLDSAVAEIEQNPNLDYRQKQILMEAKRQEEQARFDAEKRRIEDAERAKIRLAETDKRNEIRRVEDMITAAVQGLAPLPALLLGLLVLIRKLKLERAGIEPARRRKS